MGAVVLSAAASLDGYQTEADDGLGLLDEVAEPAAGYHQVWAGVGAGRLPYTVRR